MNKNLDKEKIIFGLCSDHGGFEVKNIFKQFFSDNEIHFVDYGTNTSESCDYPDFVKLAYDGKREGDFDFLIASCTSGQGINITANRYGFNSVLIYDIEQIPTTIQHNNANCFVFPALLYGNQLGEKEIRQIIEMIISSSFEEGRHQRRIDKIPF